MRSPTPALLILFALGVAGLTPASARVGETQSEFDARILRPDVGKFTPKRKNPNPAKEDELLRQQPFNAVRIYFPEGTRERKYWKSAVARMLSNENGWNVHVFFLENHSVLEAYLRIGDTLNEFEIQNILRANKGESEWRMIDNDSDESRESPLGCDYALADGSLKARVTGNWIMIYSTKLEAHVVEQLRLKRERQSIEESERLRRLQSSAPDSTAGF